MADLYFGFDRPRPARRRRWRLPPAPATWTLALINVAVFVADYIAAGGRACGPVTLGLELHPEDLWQGAWWPLLSSVFVHAGLGHLASNLAALLVFGWAVEPAIGARRLFTAYALTAVAGSLGDLLLDPSYSLGASAAIFGISGVLVALLWRSPAFWWRWRTTGRRWLWTLLTLWCIASTWDAEGVGYIAHLAGLLVGLWYGASLPVTPWVSRRARRSLCRRRAGLAAAMGAAAVVVAFSFWQPGWWLARAMGAAESGDWASARTDLFAVEACADPERYEDARMLGFACVLSLGHRDSLRARELLEPIVRTLDRPLFYKKLGDLQGYVLPYKESAALASYHRALGGDPEYVPVMGDIAWLHLTAEDSTVHDPVKGLAMARRAVAATSGVDAGQLMVLAEAQYQNGDTLGAFRSLEAAARLDPASRGHCEGERARMRKEAGEPPAAGRRSG